MLGNSSREIGRCRCGVRSTESRLWHSSTLSSNLEVVILLFLSIITSTAIELEQLVERVLRGRLSVYKYAFKYDAAMRPNLFGVKLRHAGIHCKLRNDSAVQR